MPKILDNGPGEFHFPGFHKPNYTLVPDELFDELLAILSGAELKVLMYIIRRTFGFKKDADNISLSQMLRGISTSDRRVLDKGTGLSKPTLLQALRSLQEKNIIYTERNRSVENGDEPTTYRLNVGPKTTETGDNNTPGKKTYQGGGKKILLPLVKKHDSQDRVKQETEESINSNIRNKSFGKKPKKENREADKRDYEELPEATLTDPAPAQTRDDTTIPVGNSLAEIRAWQKRNKANSLSQATTATRTPAPSGGPTTALLNPGSKPMTLVHNQHDAPAVGTAVSKTAFQEDREMIGAYIEDVAREFHDDALLKSSITRAVHLFEECGLTRSTFISKIMEARSVTKESSGSIKKKSTRAESAFELTNRMPYFFQVLTDKCGLQARSGQAKSKKGITDE